MSIEHRWNDTESKRKKYCEQTVAQSFCTHHCAGLAMNPAFPGEIPVTAAWIMADPEFWFDSPLWQGIFFSSPKPPEQLWEPPVLIFNGCQGPFRGIKRARWKLTVSLHLMPRFPMRGAIPTISPYIFIKCAEGNVTVFFWNLITEAFKDF
jgi:hypothetical protein